MTTRSKGKKQKGNFYGGISGLQVPVPKYLFPEEHKDSSRLTYYATFFNSIEINSTFYKLPLERTVTGWASMVPEDFRFTFKLWKEITHVKGLDFKETDIEKYFKIIAAAGSKKGCVLIQFPPSLGSANVMQLDALLRCVQQNNVNKEWKIAVEFRNRYWYNEDVYDLLNLHGAALVIQEIPKSATPLVEQLPDFVYVRFHGPTGNYRDSYSDSFLAEYATYINEWREEGKTVYAYFNNTMGDAFQNLQLLRSFIK